MSGYSRRDNSGVEPLCEISCVSTDIALKTRLKPLEVRGAFVLSSSGGIRLPVGSRSRNNLFGVKFDRCGDCWGAATSPRRRVPAFPFRPLRLDSRAGEGGSSWVSCGSITPRCGSLK